MKLLRLVFAAQAVSAYRIAIVPKNTASKDFYGLVHEGCIDRTSTEDNVTCYYTGTEYADVEGSVRIINELVDNETIDAISVSVLDPDAYAPAINRGMALGKPILTFDSDAPNSDRLAYVGTDNYAMGRELAKLLKQLKPDGGTYGIVSGFGDNLEKRVQGVRDVLEESPWIEVSRSPKNGEENSDISLDKMWELVEENPDMDAIVSVVGLPMFKENTTDWKNFVDSNRNVLTVIADTLPIQLDLMQTSYVNALVGQLPYNMGFQSAETLFKVLNAVDSGIPLNESLPSDVIFGTHQLEVLRIPLQLPPFDFDPNYIGKVAIVGYVLCALVVLGSFGFVAWTYKNRTTQVVRSGQAIFLTMICVGTLLMGSAIIPLSIDDSKGQRAADIACMSSMWLINIGFVVAFSALFSKIWRLNKILLSKNSLRRVKVTEKDVMLPFVVLLTMNIIALACWTAIAPLRYVRTIGAGTDPWNRNIESYGQCKSTSGAAGNSIPYVVVIGVINFSALVFANVQAYRARNVRTEFNESSYIAMANASFLQAICICVPILFLTRENPQAYFVVVSVVLFILSAAILIFIFAPKIVALRERRKNPEQAKQSSVRISGLSHGSSLAPSNTSFSSFRSNSQSSMGDDPVKALLQQYQKLPYADKAAVMKKLSPTPTYSSRSLGHSSGELEPIISSPEEEEDEQAEKDKKVDPTPAVALETVKTVSDYDVTQAAQDDPAGTALSDSVDQEGPIVSEEVP